MISGSKCFTHSEASIPLGVWKANRDPARLLPDLGPTTPGHLPAATLAPPPLIPAGAAPAVPPGWSPLPRIHKPGSCLQDPCPV